MKLAGWIARARASPWAQVAARIVVTAAALLVLAWIGRAATATASAPALDVADGSATIDAAPLVVALEVPDAAAPAAPPGPRGRASPADPVYVNVATVDELRRLPGVGAKRADAILALRQRIGRFQHVEDLMRVKGVGRGTLRKWRPLVRLDVPDAGPNR